MALQGRRRRETPARCISQRSEQSASRRSNKSDDDDDDDDDDKAETSTMSFSHPSPLHTADMSNSTSEDAPIHSSNNIQPIHATTIHRMVAGQAITDLTSAVKELVDNALDAGARSISIRLVSYGGENAPGVDEIEVSGRLSKL